MSDHWSKAAKQSAKPKPRKDTPLPDLPGGISFDELSQRFLSAPEGANPDDIMRGIGSEAKRDAGVEMTEAEMLREILDTVRRLDERMEQGEVVKHG